MRVESSTRDNRPALSAVMVAGPLRDRAERTLRGLARQTAIAEIEAVVVDTARPGARELLVPEGLRVEWVDARHHGRGGDRTAGVRAARAPVVALIEDHAVPEAGWAAALIDAHRGPWDAVGFAFTVPEPSTYLSRAGLVSEAGAWMHPARRRRVRALPGSNVSLKRDVLLRMAEVEDPSLLHGHVLWSQPGRDGHGMLIEPGAVVAHEFLPGLWPLLAVNFGHGRLLGAARCAGWGRARRAIWALGTPLSAPVVRAWRLASSFPGPGAALRALAYAPVLVGSFTAAALGEALGYAAGAGVWPERIERYELEAPRLDSIVGLNRGSGGGGAERSRQANP